VAVRLVIDSAAVESLTTERLVFLAVGEVADQLAQAIAARAPKRSGDSAASIHAEPAPLPADGYRVSWDRRHFYLSFANTGTRSERSRHFVDDALASFQGS
jgi:hypothetical protein